MKDFLSPRDVADLLRRSSQARKAILVGGQALNFWAVHYRLSTETAALSRDIDFFGNRKDALAANRDWKGKVNLADFDDHTVNAAVVVVEINNETHGIDFLTSIAGVDTESLRKNAIQVQAPGYEFSVMHPLHVMQSQVENVYGLLKRRDDPDGKYYVGRLELAIKVAAAAITELLKAKRHRDALNFAEAMGTLAATREGIDAWLRDGLDLLQSIPERGDWPKKFLDKRLPQLRAHIQERRERRVLLQQAIHSDSGPSP